MHLLGPALPRFRARHPKLSVDLRLSDRFVDLIEEGIDVAIRVGELADSRLVSRRLAPHRLGAFAAPVYLARRGTPRHPDDLVHHDCVNFRFQSTGQALRWPFQVGGRRVEFTPHAGIVADFQRRRRGGAGGRRRHRHLADLHRRAARRPGALVPVLQDFAVDRSVFTALWPESRRGSPNVKAFLAFLDEVFPSPAPWDGVRPPPPMRGEDA